MSVMSRSPRPARIAEAVLLSRAIVVWLALIAAEIVHGVIRARYLVPRVGDRRARQVGVLTGSALILLIGRLAAPWLRAWTPRAQALVGGLWLGLTLAFEVGFGRFVLRASWGRIASDYDPRRGGVLPVGLLILALAPGSPAPSRAIVATGTAESCERRGRPLPISGIAQSIDRPRRPSDDRRYGALRGPAGRVRLTGGGRRARSRLPPT